MSTQHIHIYRDRSIFVRVTLLMTATEVCCYIVTLHDMVPIRLKATMTIFIPLRRLGGRIIWVIQWILINGLAGRGSLDHPGGSTGLRLGSSSYASNCRGRCLGTGSGCRDGNGMGSGCEIRRGSGGRGRGSSSSGPLCLGRSRGGWSILSIARGP